MMLAECYIYVFFIVIDSKTELLPVKVGIRRAKAFAWRRKPRRSPKARLSYVYSATTRIIHSLQSNARRNLRPSPDTM